MNNSFKKLVRYTLIIGGYLAIINLVKEDITKTMKETTKKIYRDI